jgi:trk system potassium uptake protein TrkH
MTIATLVGMSLGKRLTWQERRVLQEGLHTETLEGIGRFAALVFGVTICLELAATAVLTVHWLDEFGASRAAYLALFHSVSAFNNAGFSLFSTSLVDYRADLVVNLVVMALVISGGAGFLVLFEVGRFRTWRRFSLHTKLVLAMTLVLVAAATAAVFLLERGNPRTLGELSAAQAWLAAFFQAVTPRTAGFNTVDIGALTVPTLFVLIMLMFIGAGPGSTAGGVKISTFVVTILALWATIRGLREPSAFGRRLPPELVARAFFISLIAFLAVNVALGALLVLEGRPFLSTLFEATSAFGTVGLSTGSATGPVSLVGEFSAPGKLLVAAMMFTGRLGPLTLAVALAGREVGARVRYPEGKVLIG